MLAVAGIVGGAPGADGQAGLLHFIDDRAADGEIITVELFAVDPARRAELQFAAFRIAEQDKAALSSGKLDDGIHHLLKDAVHVKITVEHRSRLRQRAKLP